MTVSAASSSSVSAYQEPHVELPPPPPPPPAPEVEQGDLPQETAGEALIDGGGSGTKLPSGRTPDGKEVAKTQLADGEQATLVREETRSGGIFGGGTTNNQVVLTTKGEGNDQVSVNQRDDGTLDVTVNGESYEVKLAQGQEFGIRVGNGNDVVTVAPNVKVNIVVDGGDGNDTITTGAGADRIDGGAGDDVIAGGDGRDDIFGNTGNDTIDGGNGPNVLYGGDGDDSITASGQGGVNFMEGGAGNDRLDGRNGQNILSGGLGDDVIESGGSKNSIYAGDGQDSISGVTSQDLVYAQTDVDSISFAAGQRDSGQVVMNVILDPALGTTGVRVEGSDAFRQRVEAEIEFMRSSPNGQKMLAEFDKVASERGHTITIQELSNEQNGYAMPDPSAGNVTWGDIQINERTGKPGPGVDVEIRYNTSFHMDQFPAPLVVLYHEMSHAYNFANGTLLPGTYSGPGIDRGQVPNSERQAVGLDSTAKPFDFDGDPSTPATTHNPIELTENGIRRELGLPDRPAYTLQF